MRSIRRSPEPRADHAARGARGPAGLPRRRPARYAVLTGLLACACSKGVAPPLAERRADATPVRGGILRTAFFTDVRSLDAATAFDTAAAAVEGLLYDKLVDYDDRGALAPLLAERWEASPDGTRWVFPLRRGVLFHDGEELTAEDVKRSVERALHPDTPCPVPSYYERIAGYAAFRKKEAPRLAGVEVLGTHTVAFQLSEPDSTFLHVLALPIVAPLCKSAGSTWDRNFSGKACGAGPFKLVEFTNGQVIRLTRHDGYWQKGKPYLDGVEWYLGMQGFTQRFKFERGDLDTVRELSEADGLLYRADPAWRALGAWESSLTTVGTFMNTEMAPFDNRHVRRAVSFAIDRDQLVSVRQGTLSATGRIVPRAIVPDRPGLPEQKHDLDRALEEMRLAGYPYDPATGRGGYPETIEYLAILGSFSQSAAEIYQQQLARIGIRLRIALVGWPTFLARSSRRRTVKMGFAGWHADYPEPSTFFEPTLSSRAIQDEDSQNAAFFRNQELDDLLVKARRSLDPEERRRLYERAEGIVTEEVPWAMAYEYRYWELWQPWLYGYTPHPVLTQHLRGAWIDRSAAAAGARRERTTLTLLGGAVLGRPSTRRGGAPR